MRSRGEQPLVKIGVVVSEFNYDITYLMLQKTLQHASFLGLEVAYVYKVPGVLETPLALRQVLLKPDVDGAVVIGAVLKGETKHDEVVAHQAIRKLIDVSVELGKPIGIGIIGPGATRPQALDRIEEYSRRAVEALVKMVRRSKAIRETTFVKETVFIE